MGTLLIVDGNSVLYGAQSAGKMIAGTQEVQGLYFSILRHKEVAERFGASRIITLWDGHAQWRYELYPGYKAGRDKDPKMAEIRKQVKAIKPVVKQVLQSLGVHQIEHKDYEADDLAHTISERFGKDNRVVLITGDKDWAQLVSERVSWFSPVQDQHIQLANFEAMTGYPTTRQFVEAKALQGDTSDKITGVGGIGEAGAAELLGQFGGVVEFVKAYRAGGMGKVKKAWSRLAENGENPKGEPALSVFKRNLQLMDLTAVTPPRELTVLKGRFDQAAFAQHCETYNFQSFMRRMHEFTTTFKGISS